jgi:hypothetical protein
MTEEDAKTKWCPFSRAAFIMDKGDGTFDMPVGVSSLNRFMDKGAPQLTNPPACRCLGSACMAWRWAVSPGQKHHDTADGPARGDGHCGLAGKP